MHGSIGPLLGTLLRRLRHFSQTSIPGPFDVCDVFTLSLHTVIPLLYTNAYRGTPSLKSIQKKIT